MFEVMLIASVIYFTLYIILTVLVAGRWLDVLAAPCSVAKMVKLHKLIHLSF